MVLYESRRKEGKDMAVFLSLITALVALVISGVVAEEFYIAACCKGHEERKYFWYCFLLGIIGYLLVVALPDISSNSTGICSGNAESDKGFWRCKNCGRQNLNHIGTCACGQSKD